MPGLFDASIIKNMELKNRFVRSATNIATNEKGNCTPHIVDRLEELARGGVGLIITGHTYVCKAGQASPTQMGCHDDGLVPGLTRLTFAVHNAGAKVALQLAHAGILAHGVTDGNEAIGPSPLQAKDGTVGRAMTQDEIDETVLAFAQAASRAVKAGFDAVQIHSAHGYALGQFLSPFFNKRTDDYGGTLANRARLLLRVVAAVREVVGEDYPLLVKLNSEDLLDGGLTMDEAVEVCEMLQTGGTDAIELSGGTTYAISIGQVENSWAPTKKKSVYWQKAAELYKAKVNVPLMLVGGIRSFETATELVEEGIADYVSLCRPFIREPGLVNRWKSGDLRKAACVSDNLCGYESMKGKGLHCVHLK